MPISSFVIEDEHCLAYVGVAFSHGASYQKQNQLLVGVRVAAAVVVVVIVVGPTRAMGPVVVVTIGVGIAGVVDVVEVFVYAVVIVTVVTVVGGVVGCCFACCLVACGGVDTVCVCGGAVATATR